jgi:hypothetical protein
VDLEAVKRRLYALNRSAATTPSLGPWPPLQPFAFGPALTEIRTDPVAVPASSASDRETAAAAGGAGTGLPQQPAQQQQPQPPEVELQTKQQPAAAVSASEQKHDDRVPPSPPLERKDSTLETEMFAGLDIENASGFAQVGSSSCRVPLFAWLLCQILPADKHAIVCVLQSKGYVVGMTGDVSFLWCDFTLFCLVIDCLTGSQRRAGAEAGRSWCRCQQRNRSDDAHTSCFKPRLQILSVRFLCVLNRRGQICGECGADQRRARWRD